jgi:hypothetical protein
MRTFIRHYLEMIAAMFAGMVVLGGAGELLLPSPGTAVELIGMAFSMTVPMVAWMRYRGHSWRPCIEMTASMVIPTLGVLALLAGNVMTDLGGLMALEHGVMLPAMLAAMLLRPREYMGHAHHQAAVA